jgi:hypothetical protein
MKYILKTILLTVFLSSAAVNAQTDKAQEDDFPIEYYKMEGELTDKDLFKSEFGRYDGFELPLNKDEQAYFFVYSKEFNPALILVSPEGKIFQQSKIEGGEFSVIRAAVPQTGNWYIYVVGNADDTGKYYFHYGFAADYAIELKKNSDFCTKLNYLVAHSKANFVFIENPNKKNELPMFDKAENADISDADASYKTVLYDGDSFNRAIKIFTDFNKKIKLCLGEAWNTKLNDFTKVGDHREQSVEYTIVTEDHTKMIQLILADFRNTEERFYNDYAVVIVINSI